jgi:predicted small lipoprotein YifL
MMLRPQRSALVIIAWATLTFGLLTGCGQTGPLTLPTDPASAPADDEQSDDENER